MQGLLTLIHRTPELLEMEKLQKCHGWNNEFLQKFYYKAVPFLSTTAEFFDPNAMQLHTACSISFFLPAFGT